jgi:hypothetical protein
MTTWADADNRKRSLSDVGIVEVYTSKSRGIGSHHIRGTDGQTSLPSLYSWMNFNRWNTTSANESEVRRWGKETVQSRVCKDVSAGQSKYCPISNFGTNIC